jgi:hypothetical protein
MSQTTQYRYWLDRLKRMSGHATPTAETENAAKYVECGSAKNAKSGGDDPLADAQAAASRYEVAWRLAVLRPQVPAKGPIPFLCVRKWSQAADAPRRCMSCGDPLAEGRQARCVPCQHAVYLAIHEVREGIAAS